MDALVMCGGRGTRLATDVEKPLLPVGGTPMVERVRRALDGSSVDEIYAVTSPHTPATAASVDGPLIETAGEGYVTDLGVALEDDRITTPVLTVAADLPLLEAEGIESVLGWGGNGSLTVAVPVGYKRGLGFSVDTVTWQDGTRVTPSGVNVIGAGTDRTVVVRLVPFVANVNRPSDVSRAEWLLARRCR